MNRSLESVRKWFAYWGNCRTPLPYVLCLLAYVSAFAVGLGLSRIHVLEDVAKVLVIAILLACMPLAGKWGFLLERRFRITLERFMQGTLFVLSVLLAWGLWSPVSRMLAQISSPLPSVAAAISLLGCLALFLWIALPRLGSWLRSQ